MKLRLFIADDEAPARVRLTTLLGDIAAECPNLIVGEADNAAQALIGIAHSKPDILLLDVHMPGMSGIALAAQLAEAQAPTPAIIFITAHDAYALDAFEVQALDYLLKPVRASRLADALRRFKPLPAVPVLGRGESLLPSAADQEPDRRRHFSVQERTRVLLVPIDDVLYLKAELKYVTLHTRAREYLIEASLVSLEHELAATFVRVHRNALVARSAICGVERASGLGHEGEDQGKGGDYWQVILRDVSERLPISRRQWPVLKALVR
ncbi:MAG: response regulator transcription factor [Glaciimonas sp.]|nr:response regulator transcription factor [Glaciimonas sp.]